MDVHLVDGTYELFRYYFAVPRSSDTKGNEIGAVRGVLGTVLALMEQGATHVGVATDHVIESFRNQLYGGYKTSEGVPEPLLSQFPVVEEALALMGVVVWPMIEFEADDALASAAAKAACDAAVSRVIICTPDKDLAQCIVGARVVQLDRMRNILRDQAAVVSKWGVQPESIPDYLALLGDSADGYPGLPGWGPRGAAMMLSEHPHLEDIPKDWRQWNPAIRGAKRLSAVLREQWEEAILYRTLATLRTDVPVFESVEELRWRGPRPEFEQYCEQIRSPGLFARAAAMGNRA